MHCYFLHLSFAKKLVLGSVELCIKLRFMPETMNRGQYKLPYAVCKTNTKKLNAVLLTVIYICNFKLDSKS